ncbi:hypothetical protein, partial [Edaphobacter sp. HDX4]|uniref:hypothetical protein n=1 Tax=Edaphobacter sp. HDX4 TaxID=2794064 RepID=UPI002FE53BDF
MIRKTRTQREGGVILSEGAAAVEGSAVAPAGTIVPSGPTHRPEEPQQIPAPELPDPLLTVAP